MCGSLSTRARLHLLCPAECTACEVPCLVGHAGVMRGQGHPTRSGPARQVLGGVGGHHSAAEGRNMLLGNACLLLNTLAMALYYLTCAAPPAARMHALPARRPPAMDGWPPSRHGAVMRTRGRGTDLRTHCRGRQREPGGLMLGRAVASRPW